MGGKERYAEWEFDSSSTDKVYVTVLWDDLTLSCNCPGWIHYHQKNGGCKHTKKLEPAHLLMSYATLPHGGMWRKQGLSARLSGNYNKPQFTPPTPDKYVLKVGDQVTLEASTGRPMKAPSPDSALGVWDGHKIVGQELAAQQAKLAAAKNKYQNPTTKIDIAALTDYQRDQILTRWKKGTGAYQISLILELPLATVDAFICQLEKELTKTAQGLGKSDAPLVAQNIMALVDTGLITPEQAAEMMGTAGQGKAVTLPVKETKKPTPKPGPVTPTTVVGRRVMILEDEDE